MPPPIVNLIRPNRVWSAGGTLVQIDGNDFRMPRRSPVAGGVTPAPAPSVEVLFDGIPSPRVQVISTAIIRCLTPRHPPDRIVNGTQIRQGTVAVTVRNIDDAGAPIGGESTTLPASFSFVRPELGSKMIRGAWLRVVDAFLEHWRDIAMENVAWNPSVDYDAETGDVRGYIEMAGIPGIAITKISFPDSETEPEGGPVEVGVDDQTTLLRRPPMMSDITFTLVLVSDSQGELVNLSEVVKTCFRDAALFAVQVDPDNPDLGEAEFAMLMSSPITFSDRIGSTKIVTAEVPGMIVRVGSLDLPGAPLEGLPGVPRWQQHQATTDLVRPLDRVILSTGSKR